MFWLKPRGAWDAHCFHGIPTLLLQTLCQEVWKERQWTLSQISEAVQNASLSGTCKDVAPGFSWYDFAL